MSRRGVTISEIRNLGCFLKIIIAYILSTLYQQGFRSDHRRDIPYLMGVISLYSALREMFVNKGEYSSYVYEN